MRVLSDSTTLVGLASIHRFNLLHQLFDELVLVDVVHDEVVNKGKGRPGEAELRQALAEGWATILPVAPLAEMAILAHLDRGEAVTIAAAAMLQEQGEQLLVLLDDRQGRLAAQKHGLPVSGVVGVLLAAKQKGIIAAIMPLLTQLRQQGFRLHPTLIQKARQLAGE